MKKSIQFNLINVELVNFITRAQIKSALKKRIHEQENSPQSLQKTKNKAAGQSSEPQNKKTKTEGEWHLLIYRVQHHVTLQSRISRLTLRLLHFKFCV